jgi:glycogen synthase
VYFFAKALRDKGHEVKILSLDGTSRNYDGFEVEARPLSVSRFPFAGNWKREKEDLPVLADWLKKNSENYDLAHAHHKWSIVALGMAKPVRFFATIRDYWPICICGRSQYRTGKECSKIDFTRCSFSENPLKGTASPFVYRWFEERLKERRELLKSAEKIFCISHHLRDQLLPFFPASQLIVLPNSAEPIPAQRILDLKQRFCLYVGRLEKNKGAHLLPEIMRKSKVPIPIVIVGEGSLQNQLIRKFQKRGNVASFLGYQEYPEMLSVLKQSEFVLFPSTWAEPLGRVLLEAAMAGKPVIAFQHPGGHHEIVYNNVNSLLVKSTKDFAAAVSRLASDEKLRQRLGEDSRKIYEQRFSPDAVISKLIQQYESSA